MYNNADFVVKMPIEHFCKVVATKIAVRVFVNLFIKLCKTVFKFFKNCGSVYFVQFKIYIK